MSGSRIGESRVTAEDEMWESRVAAEDEMWPQWRFFIVTIYTANRECYSNLMRSNNFMNCVKTFLFLTSFVLITAQRYLSVNQKAPFNKAIDEPLFRFSAHLE